MFISKVAERYKIQATAEMLEKMIQDAREELDDADKKLTQARNAYAEQVEKGADATLEVLERMEKEIDDLEKAHEEAARDYDHAMSTTLEDMEAEHHYGEWKSNR